MFQPARPAQRRKPSMMDRSRGSCPVSLPRTTSVKHDLAQHRDERPGHRDERRGLGSGRRPALRRPLIAAPPAGPSVTSSVVSELRVLGDVPLPAGSVPDPVGAVVATPPLRSAVSASVSRSPLQSMPSPSAAPSAASTPQRRWLAAVAAHPLETPRPLPAAFHPLARTITGRRTLPRFTTGPATRHALAAAGALGATTGSVVHLAASPTGTPGSSGVLAHELAHTRRPVSRPRFLLAGGAGPADEDEREALAAGHGILGRSSFGATTAPERPVGAGIVGQLPVGTGVGALGDIAVNAARAALSEATATSGFGGAGPSSAERMASGNAGDTASADTATGATGGTGTGGGTAAGGTTTTPPAAAPGGGAALDPDRIVELVEERLLREIERRGGRWAGVF